MGYHKREIHKGVLGQFSKIAEEFDELEDAYDQGDRVLMICELADLLGAIEAYSLTKHDISLEELICFMTKTKEAFKEGKRK
jgi:phosphoribosyl-ATP pyrophosphohydrolase